MISRWLHILTLILSLAIPCSSRGQASRNIDFAIRTLSARNESEEDRLQAIQSLQRSEGAVEDATSPLLGILVDRSELHIIRAAAAEALCAISPGEQTVHAFIFVAKNSGEGFEVRSAALDALAAIARLSVAFRNDISALVADGTEESRLREKAAQTLVSIAVALASTSEDDGRTVNEVDRFHVAVSDIERVLTQHRPELSSSLQPAFQALNRARAARSTSGSAWSNLHANPWFWPVWILLPPFACLPVWIFLLNYCPIWIWRINALLQKLPESKRVSRLNIPFGLRGYLLISVFQYHTRVLDSWLEERWPTIVEAFESMESVADRNIHVPIPVVVNGRTVRVPDAADFREEFLKPVTSLMIVAEEGMGKTSLAFKIARWVMADSVQDRVASHRIVPISIENDFNNVRFPNLDSLILRIQQTLQSVSGPMEISGTDLVTHLLRTRRILVIFDNVTDASQGIMSLMRRDSQVREILRAFIITSPLRELKFEDSGCVVEPLPVGIQDLARCYQNLFERQNASEVFRDSEILEACLEFHLAAGWSEIPVWIFRLWGDWMLSAKHHSTRQDRPGSVPDLVILHVEDMNRGIPADERLEIASVVRAFRTVSWQCLKEYWRPVATDKSAIINAIGGEARAGQLLAYLKKMRFVSFEGTSPERLRVESGPLAEYLAALHLCETFRSDSEAWTAALESISQQAATKAGCRGFIKALYTTCLAKAEELGIPDVVEAEIGCLAGKFPAEWVSATSDRHVRKMIRQLSLPNPEDRRAAALGLIGMGLAAKGAIPALVSRLSRIDESMDVRSTIVRVLGDIGPQSDSVITSLVKVLKDPFSSLGPAATRSLVRIGSKALAGLIEVAKEPRRSESFRIAALKTIGAFDRFDPQAVESLRTILKDRTAPETVRAGVAEAFANAGEPALTTVPDFIDLMLESRTLRLSAANAIIAMSPGTRPSVISLFEALNNRGSRSSEATLALLHNSLLLSKKSSSAPIEPQLSASIKKAFEHALSLAKTRASDEAISRTTHVA